MREPNRRIAIDPYGWATGSIAIEIQNNCLTYLNIYILYIYHIQEGDYENFVFLGPRNPGHILKQL